MEENGEVSLMPVYARLYTNIIDNPTATTVNLPWIYDAPDIVRRWGESPFPKWRVEHDVANGQMVFTRISDFPTIIVPKKSAELRAWREKMYDNVVTFGECGTVQMAAPGEILANVLVEWFNNHFKNWKAVCSAADKKFIFTKVPTETMAVFS